MKRYEVLITDKAYNDLEEIHRYIAKELLEPLNAARVHDMLVEAIWTLETMATRVRVMNSQPDRAKGLRPLLVENYIVFYVIRGEAVFYSKNPSCIN